MSPRLRRVPTRLAAQALGIPEATIRQWAKRGKVTRYGTPTRAMYDLAELMTIVDEPPNETERSAGSRNGLG